jgi:hypothetical protein
MFERSSGLVSWKLNYFRSFTCHLTKNENKWKSLLFANNLERFPLIYGFSEIWESLL